MVVFDIGIFDENNAISESDDDDILVITVQ